jgi:hypothetical protein
MKIISIFAERLYAFHYPNETDNEYDRLMELWTDVLYLREYAKRNGINDTTKFIRDIRKDAEYIQDLIEYIAQNKGKLETLFKPLNDLETGIKVLSLQKGKIRHSYLRLYAIKIDENLFVIVGGAIKLTPTMKEHPDTQQEKIKLEQAKIYLQGEDIFDSDSFYELLMDNNNDK